ncbi:MAG: YbaB/EbfC family nucleoid-associated protein [Alphaproteobacteria bacterium]|nr:YbaB/EbfC family nucleoid-associated protein [Alphaproteobacteria bacterium]
MKNLAGLMKQATDMQKKMEELQTALEAMEAEGSAGAGMVSATLNGKGVLKSVRIDPKIASAEDVDMLQDLIVAAHADAQRKIDTAKQAEMQRLTGGLSLPPGFKLPF